MREKIMSKTTDCLVKAFLGESQARNRYSMYAKVAGDDGYEQIAEIFRETSEQERIHGKRLFLVLQEIRKKSKDESEIKMDGVGVPTTLGTTADNLKAAMDGELYESGTMYPEFAKIAESEGEKDAAMLFKSLMKAEGHHKERYAKLLDQVSKGTVFKKEKKVKWVCRECGYEIEGTAPPEKCPLCGKPHGFYQVKSEEY
jgi:rubrerythrin